MLDLRRVADRLTRALGRQDWWPAESAFEMMLGAVLVQNTRWHNVTLAMALLREAGLLDPDRWNEVSDQQVLAAIHSCGFHRAKLRATRGLADWMREVGDAELRQPSRPDPELRAELRSLAGVGEETADAILLYAFDRPTFIYDAYARRMFDALTGAELRSYAAARRAHEACVARAGFTLDELQQLHALIDEFGKLVASGARSWAELR
ncbi:endonuclease III domain-containing protein [Leucobacter chromiireducens]|uniref:HhH-GPD domain-containing protein n=1 Tax=Leucobacter chromiireducens subsp. chromiireducens TaxID=660067 RepID=A0ABS1SR15_9MICO|nr:hypothetical protein [Leucobacter chromiireducens]MBL3690598.1 hypothetical protein [Leucobacter chromiireducens subsp. chromiireducens]